MKALACFIALALCGSTSAFAQAADAAQVESGARIYRYWCVECHNARGFGTVSLERRYQGAIPAILEQRRDLNSAFIQYVTRNGMSFMPSFRKTEITDKELAALTAYLTGDPTLRTRGQ